MTSSTAAELMESLPIRCPLTGKVCSLYTQREDDWSCDDMETPPTNRCPGYGESVIFIRKQR